MKTCKITLPRYRAFTTTYPEEFLRTLEDVSAQLHVPKNTLLETAFWSWKKQQEQLAISESYKNLTDQDRTELAALADENLTSWDVSIDA